MNEKTVNEILNEYNRLRSPEATASLTKIKDNKLWLKFQGPFCESCGVYDYFEDFIIEAQNEKIKLIIKSIEQIDVETYFVQFENF